MAEIGWYAVMEDFLYLSFEEHCSSPIFCRPLCQCYKFIILIIFLNCLNQYGFLSILPLLIIILSCVTSTLYNCLILDIITLLIWKWSYSKNEDVWRNLLPSSDHLDVKEWSSLTFLEELNMCLICADTIS